MMLTIEEFAEIPTKMHAFYGQAFDTLFQRHDALKAQFNRETKTGLTKDLFKRCLSAFCLTSYLEEKYTLSEDAAVRHAEAATRYVRQSTSQQLRGVTGANLVSDLIQCVNILQPDGLDLTFVHRSFQEYFAALFVVSYHDDRLNNLLDKFAERFADSALTMAFDMAREKIEAEWVTPRLSTKLAEIGALSLLSAQVAYVYKSLTLMKQRRGKLYIFADFNPQYFGQLYAFSKLYPRQLPAKSWLNPVEKTVSRSDCENIELKGLSSSGDDFLTWLAKPYSQDEREIFNVDLSTNDDWLEKLGFGNSVRYFLSEGPKIIQAMEQREKRRTSVIEEFLTPRSS